MVLPLIKIYDKICIVFVWTFDPKVFFVSIQALLKVMLLTFGCAGTDTIIIYAKDNQAVGQAERLQVFSRKSMKYLKQIYTDIVFTPHYAA